MTALAVLDHELTAVDHVGRWCVCGQPFTPEHLYAVAEVEMNLPPLAADFRATKEANARRRRHEKMLDRLARTRSVLAQQQAAEDALAARMPVGLDLGQAHAWLQQHRGIARRYDSEGKRIS